jgi:hypothetical protein
MVAGSNHIFPGACGSNDCFPVAYASSNGIAWTKTVLPRNWKGVNHGIGFDPSIDVNSSGTFFYVYGIAPLSGSYPNGIVMVKSTDGVNWTQTNPATYNTKQFFDDKYWLAVDRTRTPNRIYISWDRNTSTNQILYVIYSDNEGTTWRSPIKVDDGTSKFERVIGAYPAVDNSSGSRRGTVYTSWHNYAKNKIFIDKSTNGGASWGADVAAATTHAGFGQDIGCVGGRAQGPAHHLKVDSAGTLHLVYADSISRRGFDILYTRSVDGGASWSPPVTLNDDSTSRHQYHPALAVDGTTVTVSFYDRRNDPNNCLSQVYATQSTNGGLSWSVNTIVDSTNSNFDGNPNGPGDYSSGTWSGLGTFSFFSTHPPSSPFDITAAAIP